jgi:hypothetical protein
MYCLVASDVLSAATTRHDHRLLHRNHALSHMIKDTIIATMYYLVAAHVLSCCALMRLHRGAGLSCVRAHRVCLIVCACVSADRVLMCA